MKTFIKWLVLAPIGLAILAFSYMNRHFVTVVLDPFGNDIPGLSLEAPLFLVMFASAALGVLAGSAVTWFGQGKHRRAARDAKAEAARLRALTPQSSAVALPSPGASKAA